MFNLIGNLVVMASGPGIFIGGFAVVGGIAAVGKALEVRKKFKGEE